MIKIIEFFLNVNGHKSFDTKSLEMQMMIHPNYPSFKSVTDTLDYFNIENIAVKVPKETFAKLPKYFLSLIDGEKGEEIVSVQRGEENVVIRSENDTKKISIDNFIQIWIPNVIAVEEIKSKIKNANILKQALGTGIILSILGIILTNYSGFLSLLFIMLSMGGVYLASIFLNEELGQKSDRFNQFCNSISNSTCTDVINKGNVKFLGKVSFGDASIIYFSSLCIYSLIFGLNNVILIPLICSIPVLFYSLFVQFSLKKWCVLCLITVFLSLSLLFIGIATFSFSFHPSEFFLIAFVFSIMAFFTVAGKEHFVKHKKLTGKYLNVARFKRNPEIFTFFLEKSQKAEDFTYIQNEIILGNPRADFKIFAITNPFCGFCEAAFESYANLLKMSSDIQIVLRFKVDHEDLTSGATLICLRLFEIFNEKGEKKMIEAYVSWFNNKNLKIWFKNHGKPKDINPKFVKALKIQNEWAKKEKIDYTPTTIVNKKFYPKQYGYEEFLFFVKELQEIRGF